MPTPAPHPAPLRAEPPPVVAARAPRAPTLEDVARLAGVSRALVSLVVRQSPKVSAHSRVKVLAACEELGYRPNLHARNLAAHGSGIIGALVSDLHNPFFAEVVDGLHTEAAVHGQQVIITSGGRQAEGERVALETLLSLRPAGVVMIGPVLDAASVEQASVRAGGTPVVSVTRVLRSNQVDTVTIDEYAGTALAVAHLVELGHRRIVHLDGGGGAGSASRRTGYLRAMRAAGLDQHARVVRGAYTENAGWEATDRLLRAHRHDPLPTALFAGNDVEAVGALSRLAEAGVAVPGEVSVVGFDDTAIAASRFISLTTVHQPKPHMGRLALRTLLERTQGRTEPVRHVVAPSLVVRTSSARVRATPDTIPTPSPNPQESPA